jgi:2-C-methyl-D-erythritol 4-phosphate cytidylyltransferase
MNVAVIFVAAHSPLQGVGSGKYFTKIENREVFMRTIEVYAARDEVTQRILAVLPGRLATVQAKYAAHLGFQGVQVAAGGPDWFGALGRALEKLNPDIDTVMVHDAACPAVSYHLLNGLQEAMAKAEAAAPVVTANPNVVLLAPDRSIESQVDGANVYEVQTPQIFKKDVLAKAYAGRTKAHANFADDAELVQNVLGTKVATVVGERFNIRADSEGALKILPDILNRIPKPRKAGPASPFEEAQW